MSHSVVIVGASGDLTSRKLIPALYLLHRKGRLPSPCRIVGFSRSSLSHDEFRNQLAEAVGRHAGDQFTTEAWQAFAQQLFYCAGDIAQPADVARLQQFLTDLEDKANASRLYYLSTLPSLYEQALQNMGAAGMSHEENGIRRVVIEKPFGSDLPTAKRLNGVAHQVFSEQQIYRIDHYLGKETVQNLLVLRFANSIFEPVWNRNYVDHVQITVAEEVRVGRRGAYYDQSGVLRDMFQNHLLQLMMITAMECPARYEAGLVRDEKVKVLQAIRPLRGADFARDTLRGQYAGYLKEEGVAANSQTATCAVLKLHVDNWRWQGVPFYLRSGKAMSCRTTQIVIQFRPPPHLMFDVNARREMEANRLVLQIQPAEGIQLHFQTKVPDQGMRLRMTDLDFRFHREYTEPIPDSYQRLLLDAMNGDASLFARNDEVELAWGIIDPILAAWNSPAAPPLEIYPAGEWGPEGAAAWIRQQGRDWFDVCPVFHDVPGQT